MKLESERVVEFLTGLNCEFDDVRGRILGWRPLPSTREVFLEVRHEERQQSVMLREMVEVPRSTLISHGPIRPKSEFMLRWPLTTHRPLQPPRAR